MSYSAVVSRLVNVRPHPNADRLCLANACASQVVVSKDAKESAIGVFFGDDGVLSQEMARENNLFSISELNKDPGKKGFFGNPPRVKAQNFRGEKSYGFWVELESLAWTGVDISTLKEGDEFTHLNGHEICRKYINPATLRAASRERKAQKLASMIQKKYSALKEHFDTKQLRKDAGSIPKDSILYVTSKCHGCVSGDTLVDTLEYGPKQIQELVHSKADVHIKALDISSGAITFEKPCGYYFVPDDGEWYEVELESGEKLTITGNNPVYLPGLGCYRRVDELVAGDSILLDE